MQKISSSLIAITILIVFSANLTYAFSFTKIKPAKEDVLSSLSAIKLSDFIKLSAADYEILSGKKMNFAERLSFKRLQSRMKHTLKRNADLTVADYFKAKGEGGFNIIWFLAGLLIPIAALFTGSLPVFIILAISPVVLAYLTKQESDRKKSVWLGFGVSLLAILLVGIMLASTLNWQ